MSDAVRYHERGKFGDGKYVLCGSRSGVEVLRYEIPDGRKPGVIFRYDGGLLTVRHVVDELGLPGYKIYGEGYDIPDIDIAYRADAASRGLKLGYVDSMGIFGAEIIASEMNNPKKLFPIKGNIFVGMMPTNLKWFSFSNPDDTKFFKPGISGSPIVYNNHVIVVVPYRITPSSGEAPVVTFMGGSVKKMMEEFGLQFEQIR